MEQQKLDRVHRIVLTGFMGSGKSTVGLLLAQRLGWAFTDLDTAIEERCSRTVSEIFAEFGEERFRQEETAALVPLMQQVRTVVALGGGAPETPENRELLQQAEAAVVIFLDAPFDTLCERCGMEAEQRKSVARPLLLDRLNAATRYRARQPHYRAIATFRLETTGLSPTDVVERILLHLL